MTLDAMRMFNAQVEFINAAAAWLKDGGDVQGVVGFRQLLIDGTDKAIAAAERRNETVRALMPEVSHFVAAHCFARPKPESDGPAMKLEARV